MNPTPPPSENLFLRSYAAWRQHSVKLTGKLLMLAMLPLALLMLWMGVLAFTELQQSTARQANAIGDALVKQIAASVAEPLAADDQLSLNILLAQWRQNPLVAHTRVFTLEKRMIAEAGDRVSGMRTAPGQGQFNAAVYLQDTLAGQVQLSLAAEPFMAPVNNLMRQLAWAALLLALIAGFLAWRMAGNMRKALQQLGEWQAESPAPGQDRRDELGDLARQMGTRYQDPNANIEPPEADPEDSTSLDLAEIDAIDTVLAGPIEDEETAAISNGASAAAEPDAALPESLGAHLVTAETHDTTELANNSAPSEVPKAAEDEHLNAPAATITATQKVVDAAQLEASGSDEKTEADSPPTPPAPLETTVLAIRLGNQEALRRLPRPRLMALLGRYREQLDRACKLYNGHIQTLHDGTSLVVFNAKECRQDELTHALCCGELLRVLGHDLQVEIADTGITLHLHLALCHSPCLSDVPEQDLAAQPACQTLIEQVQYSRNLLLLDSSLANCDAMRQRAVVRRLASQPGIYCIERLQDPYQAMLEQQLNHFYQQRQS